METQFNINIAVQGSSIVLTTDLKGLSELSAHTTRDYSRYFAQAHELLQGSIPGEVVDENQSPLPGL